jgi:hypothetical protein
MRHTVNTLTLRLGGVGGKWCFLRPTAASGGDSRHKTPNKNGEGLLLI